MTTPANIFQQLHESLEKDGVEACLARLAMELRQQGRHHDLFEAEKMRVRQRFGLPLLTSDLPEELSPDARRELEDRLITAYREVYREVGLLMFKSGELRQGWLLLQAAGEEGLAAQLLGEMERDPERMDEFIDVALHQGVAPHLGFAAVLEHYGTCNAITTFEQLLYNRPRADQQAAAALLVDHLRRELIATVRADIAQQKGAEPEEQTLAALVASREWLFSSGAYHIDTTHLASTVRFARVLDSSESLRAAIDLAEYGRRLQAAYQYEGEEPFKDIYPSHSLYFHALLGEQVEEALAYFRERAEEVDVRQEGTIAAETYIALLDRLGRFAEASRATVDLIPPGVYTRGLAPTLFELCEKSGDFRPLVDACRERDDLLGFAAGLIQAKLCKR